ncbi:MAG TPA: hypothetical protein VJ044_05470, partial [Candidatus Hodarchaeales archaeon]|nr:hypothetical protein [Candidatus Hodarchaeales archaeon]
MKPIFIILLMSLLLAGTAFAGTLESGSKITVESNYAGFSGLSLLGVWTTTPTTSDYIVVKNADLSGVTTATGQQAGLRGDITVSVPAPIFEQVMKVTDQKRLIKIFNVGKSYTYSIFGDRVANCENKMNEDLATNYGGKTRLAGTQVRSVVYAGYCQVQFLIEDSQLGWYGQVSDKGWSYQQDIVLTNIGKTLKLRRTPEEGMSVSDQLTDKIDNVARVTLLGFSQWTNAPLRTSGIFAFNGKNEWTSSFPTGVWNPFTEIGDVSGYQNNLNTLKTYFSGAETSILSGTKLDDANRIKNEVNREADMIKGLGSGTITPQALVGTIDGMPRTVGNDIIAKMRKTVLLARIQMLFSGDDFGLYIPTGKPQIVSSDATIRFPEVGSGYLNVKVKNIGEAMGTFLL